MIGTIVEHLVSVSVSNSISSMFPGESWNKEFDIDEGYKANWNSLSFGDYF
jgi:hypothetical protein